MAWAASGLTAFPRLAVAAGGGSAVFLPWLAQPAPMEPCGPGGGDPCATGPSESWVTVCGGLGRVRDMVIPNLPAAGGPFELLAVGDGAAWLTVWPATTPGPPTAVRWQAHVGADLTGINALGLDLEADPRGERGWAVGERDRIFTLQGSCLHREDDYESSGVELTAVNGDTPHGGWIVGRALALDGASPREAGVWRIMANPGAPSGPSWQDYRDQVTPPPLTDVAFLYNRQFDQAEAWSVGAAAGTGVFLYGQAGPNGLWRWTERARSPGAPRELTLRSNGSEGWAFGAGTRDGQAGLASWYYLRGTANWVQDPGLFWPGRELVDVYSESRLADERMNVGLSPAGSAPAIMRLDFTTRQWQEIGRPPPGLAPTAGDGSRAIAPDSAGHTAYAWGDDVWLYHEAATTPTPAPPTAPPAGTGTPAATPSEPGDSRETGAWSLLRRARPLQGFVPIGDGGWAIADAGAGSDVLALHRQAFQALHHTARRLRSLDAASDRLWAVGDGGLTLRFEAGRWRELTGEPAVDGNLLDVAATADGGAWAAGVGADGRGRLWRCAPDGRGWMEVARTHGATALRAVAARADGRVWAVGDACTALTIAPGVPAETSQPCAGATVPVDLVAVAAPGPRSAWAGGGYYAYRWNGATWRYQALGLGAGEHVAALAAATTDDVWVAAWTSWPAGRSATTLLHLDNGAWRRDTVLNVPVVELRLSQVTAGHRTVWAAGAGSTVARREYPVPPR